MDTPQQPKANLLLVALLMVASFVVGSMYSKVQYLEKAAGTTKVLGTQTAGSQTQPIVPNQPQPSIKPQKVSVDLGHLPIKGNQTAKVEIVEFGDLRCPFCQRFYNDTEPQIIKDYIDTGKAKFAFRHYAFLGPASITAANAAECANDQGKFWEMHDYLYKNQPNESDTSLYTTEKLAGIAGTLGIDTNQFKGCLDSKKFDKNVSDDLAAGQKAGVNGTPTVFINGIPIVGAQPYNVFQSAIDAALKQ